MSHNRTRIQALISIAAVLALTAAFASGHAVGGAAGRQSGATHLGLSPMLAWRIVEHAPKSKEYTAEVQSDVYLMIGAKKVTIEKNLDGHYAAVQRGDDGKYDCSGEKKIPNSALTVCSGWWAGAGETYYVVPSGHRLKVYRIDVQEESPDFKTLVKSIPL